MNVIIILPALLRSDTQPAIGKVWCVHSQCWEEQIDLQHLMRPL